MLDETNMYAVTEVPIAVHTDFDGPKIPSVPVHPEGNNMEIPGGIWRIMFICYGIFFGGLLLATGRDTAALMMITISIGYAVMFFGLNIVLIGLDGKGQHTVKPGPDSDLQTWCGPMSPHAVAGQILTIPICFAFFGIAIVIIRAWVG